MITKNMGQRGRSKEIETSPTPLKFEKKHKGSLGVITNWKYDLTKSDRGPLSVDIIYPKDYEFPKKPKLDSSKYVGTQPVVMVYKTSERSNAKYKLKTWNNKNIDQILVGKNIGVPDNVIVLELGIGRQFIKEWNLKYKSNLN